MYFLKNCKVIIPLSGKIKATKTKHWQLFKCDKEEEFLIFIVCKNRLTFDSEACASLEVKPSTNS